MQTSLESSFPESKKNLERIKVLKEIQAKIVENTKHWASYQKDATWHSLFDPSLSNNSLARDLYEEKMDKAGGRGNAANVQGLLKLSRKKAMPVDCELLEKRSGSNIFFGLERKATAKKMPDISPYTFNFVRNNSNLSAASASLNTHPAGRFGSAEGQYERLSVKKRQLGALTALPPSPKTPKVRSAGRHHGSRHQSSSSSGSDGITRVRRKSSVVSVTLNEDIPISPLMESIATSEPVLSPAPVLGGRRITTPFAGLEIVPAHQQSGVNKKNLELNDMGKLVHFSSPLTGHERNILSQAPWRQTESKLDAHDKAVLAGMPYNGSQVVPNPLGIRTLGNVITHSDLTGRIAALSALGDRMNYGNPTCLAYILPMFKHSNRQVRLAAIRAFSQVVKPGQSKQYCEVELQIWGCTNLPKTDRHGTCDPYVRCYLKDTETGITLREERTHVLWNCLNPKWRKQYYWEIGDPKHQVVEFQVWDEDGETDELVGRCDLPLSIIPGKKNPGDEMPVNLFTIQLLNKRNDQPILGYNEASADNTGQPSKLCVKVRYGVFLLPEDLKTNTIHLLSDVDPEIRVEAIGVLMTLSGHGNQDALALIARMLEDGHEGVRKAAVKCFAELAKRNDVWAVRLVASRLHHGRKEIRHCALEALSQIVDVNNDEVTAVVCECLKHPLAEVRALMCEAASILLNASDPDVLESISKCLSDRDEGVRESSLRVLAGLFGGSEIGANGNTALSILGNAVQDVSAACRCAAVHALLQVGLVVRTSDTALVGQIVKILDSMVSSRQGLGDPVPFVRSAAARSLEKLKAPLSTWYDVEPAQQGIYSSIIPPRELLVTREGGVSSVLCTEVPTDSKYLTNLPYRPPTPLWEPKAQERRRIQAALASARAELEMAAQRTHALEAVAGTELERQQLKFSMASHQEQLARLEKEEAALSDSKPPVQPLDATKLGFRIVQKPGRAHHCDDVKCCRCRFY